MVGKMGKTSIVLLHHELLYPLRLKRVYRHQLLQREWLLAANSKSRTEGKDIGNNTLFLYSYRSFNTGVIVAVC